MSTPKYIKTTKFDRLRTAAKRAKSYSSALRELGVMNNNGRNIHTLRRVLRNKHISTKHFVTA